MDQFRPSRTIEINASKFNGLIFFTTIDSIFDIVIHQTEPLKKKKIDFNGWTQTID